MNEPHLLTVINDALNADTRIEVESLAIAQSAEDGQLTIEGLVDDIRVKRLAANVAWAAIRGCRPVLDHLRVRCTRQGELELRDDVVRKLTTESAFSDHTLSAHAGSHHEQLHDAGPDAPSIAIHVTGDVVILHGRVCSLSHRRFAEVLAWWAPGCARVDNLLDVVPPEDDDDDEITDVVRMVLEKDPLVHATQLRVGTAAAIVLLDGLVASEEERRLAELDAWYVPGVWNVVNRIEVRHPL